ncbi:MAG: UbiA prenyltransferase family protein [Chitinophagaceae bacterium]|nr:UbiA prenyltransferase family protein [Chitinophagaceae bacterium]
MPVYWFALSQVAYINFTHTIIIFFILHLLIYPASNGYNSYMDRDTGSIGGVKHPMQPTLQLLYVTIAMDVISILAGFMISVYFAGGLLAYVLVSKAYSYRKIRLKKHPFAGYLAVVVFQGAVTFWLVYHGCSVNKTLNVPIVPMVVASLLIGGFYPLTQIYQHQEDRKDGVTTISYKLGYRGTFLYCGLIYGMAFMLLAYYFFYTLQQTAFYIFSTGMLPVLIYFLIWAKKVWHNNKAADYEHTMRMNTIASVCTNIVFIVIFLINRFE